MGLGIALPKRFLARYFVEVLGRENLYWGPPFNIYFLGNNTCGDVSHNFRMRSSHKVISRSISIHRSKL